MPDTGIAKDCLELTPTNFSIFAWKTWVDELIWLVSISFCLYRACFTHLISPNLSCYLCLKYYNDQLVHFNKEISANVYRHSLWERYSKHLHCLFVHSMMWHYLWKPVLSGHYSILQGCPLNTGFTVSVLCSNLFNFLLRLFSLHAVY